MVRKVSIEEGQKKKRKKEICGIYPTQINRAFVPSCEI